MVPIPLIISGGIFIGKIALKKIVENKVTESINDGVTRSILEINKAFIKLEMAQLTNIVTNISLLLLGVYVLPLFVSKETVIFTICSIYFSSILYGVWQTITKIPNFFSFFFQYKGNVKKYIHDKIYDEVYREADNEIRNLPFFSSLMNDLFGKSAHEIAYQITKNSFSLTLTKIIWTLIRLIIVLSIYIFIFRAMIAPEMISNTTGFTWYQAFLYPFIFSIDFMFDIQIWNSLFTK